MDSGHSRFDRWGQRGQRQEVFGQRIFYLDEGPRQGPVLLLLHGFPTSSLDFHRCLEHWTEHYRVVLHDHLGFGHSDKPRSAAYSLLEQAETALGLWRSLGIEGGHLIAHDYGTSVATELLARRERGLLPLALDSVTLTNGSIYLDLARLRLAQRIARSRLLGPAFGRLVPKAYFLRTLRRLWGDPRRARAEDLEAMWRSIRHRDGHLRVHQISSYLAERQRFRYRWHGALSRLDLPAHILWARRDPVAVPAIAEKLAAEVPDARLTWLPELGHFPMLEDPPSWALAVADFVQTITPHQG